MLVRDLMTENPACTTPDRDLGHPAQLMVQNDCGGIPVVENEDTGRVLGIITDRDIVTRTVAQGQNPLQTRTSEAMTRDLVTVDPEADVEEARRLMEENQLRRLVVAKDGTCVGIIAQADLARKLPEEQAGEVVEEVSQPSGEASEPSQG